MISGATGRKIPCCWTECERLGDTRYECRVNEPRRTIHYLFCSERHKMLWVNSVPDMGNLPSGSKSALSPKG